jgi:hypothetical protein
LTAGFSHFEETEFGLVLEKSEHMTVEVQDGDIIVTVAGFYAVYYKPGASTRPAAPHIQRRP